MDTPNPSDPFSLTGKRILITGASSGIGRQISITCAQAGAQLVITGRNQVRLEATAAELAGEGHLHIVADLAQPADLERLVAEAGVLNGLAHSAGVSRLIPFRMVNQAHLDDTFASNTYAPILLTRNLLAKKQLAPNGSVLWIASIASHVGPMASAAYAASKAALMGAMRSLGREVSKQGIRVNCIAPGYVRTPLIEGLQGGGGNMDDLLDLAPLGLGEPEDVAYAAVFYLSDASRWITRTYFVIDGGLTIPMDIYA